MLSGSDVEEEEKYYYYDHHLFLSYLDSERYTSTVFQTPPLPPSPSIYYCQFHFFWVQAFFELRRIYIHYSTVLQS